MYYDTYQNYTLIINQNRKITNLFFEDHLLMPVLDQHYQHQDLGFFWDRFYDLTIDQCYPFGTPFQLSVWEAIADIPKGTTRSYGEIAALIGKPKAVRAVGTACGNNPIPIIIPCHRVVGKSNPLAYSGGAERKRALLARERVQI